MWGSVLESISIAAGKIYILHEEIKNSESSESCGTEQTVCRLCIVHKEHTLDKFFSCQCSQNLVFSPSQRNVAQLSNVLQHIHYVGTFTSGSRGLKLGLGCHNVFSSLGPSQGRPGRNLTLHVL